MTEVRAHSPPPFCISQSRNSGITGMWQDWISAGWLDCLLLHLRLHLVAKALDVRRKKEKLMDASSLRPDRSELTSAEGRRRGEEGDKKTERLIYWPGDECHSAPATDGCKVLQLLFLSVSSHEGTRVSEKLRRVIIPANREIFRLAINPVLALILVSPFANFSPH